MTGILRKLAWRALAAIALLGGVAHAQFVPPGPPPNMYCPTYECLESYPDPVPPTEAETNQFMAALQADNPDNQYYRDYPVYCHNGYYADDVHCRGGIAYRTSWGLVFTNAYFKGMAAMCFYNGTLYYVTPRAFGSRWPDVYCEGLGPYIGIEGPSMTKALPDGPPITLTVVVTQDAAAVTRSVVLTQNGNPFGGGITDSQGKFTFTYTPPARQTATVELTATCSDCINTATKVITVGPPSDCNSGCQTDRVRSDSGDKGKGNPIFPATGEKTQVELDWQDAGPQPLTFTRYYRSLGAHTSTGMTEYWSHSFAPHATVRELDAKVMMGDGSRIGFTRATTSSGWVADNKVDTLTHSATFVVYRRSADDSTWTFDGYGKPAYSVQRNGWTMTFAHDLGGPLSAVANKFGRTVTFAYDGSQRISTVTFPDLTTVGYQYDGSGRLGTATYANGTTRSYTYGTGTLAHALTGVYDESGTLFSSAGYDSYGRATSTQLGGGANAYSIAYSDATPSAGGISTGTAVTSSTSQVTATVTGPLGATATYVYQGGSGGNRLLSASAPRDGGIVASRTFGTNTLPATETDFAGVSTAYTWNALRNLPLTITSAVGLPEQQVTTMTWHTTYRLPLTIKEAGRTTTMSYDSAGNMLYRTVTDTVTGESRVWRWIYTNGQVTRAIEPNGATTTFAYDSLGNAKTVTNALTQRTLYNFDGAGRVTQQVEATGRTTTFAYDQRGRLTNMTRAGAAMTLTYAPFGEVASIRTLDGRTATFTYDAAHRLTGWQDNNSVTATYVLDALGNRTSETIKDTTGTVAFQASRTFDSDGRMLTESIGGYQTSTFAYNALGDLVSSANGLNQTTTFGLDGLRRLKSVLDPLSNTATLAYNALDAVTSAIDFKGVTTTFTRSAYGEPKVETSNDIGSQTRTFTALGLPQKLTDSIGQASTVTYDLLGRPTRVTYNDGTTSTLAYDLTGTAYNATGAANASKGFLSEIVDRSGTTRWQRDGQGRVTQKVYIPPTGSTLTTTFAFNSIGQLATMTYPGGGALGYSYTNGRITGMTWNGSALVSSIAYNAAEQPTSWSWNMSSSVPATRSYDTAGNLTSNGIASYTYDSAGRLATLTEQRLVPGDTNPANSTTATLTVSWVATYDGTGRVTGFSSNAGTTTFSYDANGNRLTSTSVKGTATDNRSYSVTASTNKLAGYTQTTNISASTVTTALTYTHDANGALTEDGVRSFHYDQERRLNSSNTGVTSTSPVTRYAHNVLGERAFKTVPVLPNATDTLNLTAFYARGWNPTGVAAEQQGWAFIYGDDGTLMGQYGTGGVATGTTQFIVLPTPNGPMPIAVIVNGTKYGVYSDHLNTPRRMVNSNAEAAWQWSYSAFGDEPATTARFRFGNLETNPNPGTTTVADVTYNLRYPGQFYDSETKLHYNYFRSYKPDNSRYTQADPIGLNGGWNRFSYVLGNPLSFVDPRGLQSFPDEGRSAFPGPFVPNPSAAAQQNLAKMLDRLFCPQEPDCWDLQQQMEELAGELRQRYVSMTADAENLFCTRPIGRFSWLGHQWKFQNKRRELQKLIEQAQARGCIVNGEYFKLAAMDPPSCPAR